MKNPTTRKVTYINFFVFLLFTCLFLSSCQNQNTDTSCNEVNNIEGKYNCSGECIIFKKGEGRTVQTVTGEEDVISKYPGAKEALYQVDISGNGGKFSELEIGVLSGLVLRTATAEVSDTTYPVLEEYIFDTDDACNAIGFTKVVRNPMNETFKACVIYCNKN